MTHVRYILHDYSYGSCNFTLNWVWEGRFTYLYFISFMLKVLVNLAEKVESYDYGRQNYDHIVLIL